MGRLRQPGIRRLRLPLTQLHIGYNSAFDNDIIVKPAKGVKGSFTKRLSGCLNGWCLILMKKFIISVLGEDRPGIIAAVTRVLFDQGYNIEEVSQTILQNQFSCFFIVTGPEGISPGHIIKILQGRTSFFKLVFHTRDLETEGSVMQTCECEPFVITTRGPDRKGLVAGITSVFAAFNVNVRQLRAVFRGGEDPDNNIMIYEVDIPLDVDQKQLRHALCEKADGLGLKISIQHKNIFEAMNRI